MEKERRNDKRAAAAGAHVEEADRTHLPPYHRSMVNWAGVVGVAQLVERRSVAPNVAGSSPVSHPNLLEPLRDASFLVASLTLPFEFPFD
jgi:hypothetical protein